MITDSLFFVAKRVILSNLCKSLQPTSPPTLHISSPRLVTFSLMVPLIFGREGAAEGGKKKKKFLFHST